MNYSSPFGYSLIAGKLRALIAVLVFICTVFIAPQAHAQLTDTLKCNSSLTIQLGLILAGDSLELPITF
ncbi:MAG TPA: hypothetical protein VFX22_11990, partial [Candidatus Kapabacteria bacterium]|nr:hypothetical protein [Candidatus Kapabacteria bacterium]